MIGRKGGIVDYVVESGKQIDMSYTVLSLWRSSWASRTCLSRGSKSVSLENRSVKGGCGVGGLLLSI